MDPETRPTVGHEETDADTRAVAWTAAVLAVVVVVVSGLSWWLLEYWRREFDGSQPAASPLAVERPDFPGPRLQAAPRVELEKYRQQQQRRLSSYGWVEEPRVVHIPIERAIDLIIQRGLPARKQADETTTPQDAADKRSDDVQDENKPDPTHIDSDE